MTVKGSSEFYRLYWIEEEKRWNRWAKIQNKEKMFPVIFGGGGGGGGGGTSAFNTAPRFIVDCSESKAEQNRARRSPNKREPRSLAHAKTAAAFFSLETKRLSWAELNWTELQRKTQTQTQLFRARVASCSVSSRLSLCAGVCSKAWWWWWWSHESVSQQTS